MADSLRAQCSDLPADSGFKPGSGMGPDQQVLIDFLNRYPESWEYYGEFKDVVDTAWWGGFEQGFRQGVEQERSRLLERQRSLVLRLLERSLGTLLVSDQTAIQQLSLEQLEVLNEALLSFSTLEDLTCWLEK